MKEEGKRPSNKQNRRTASGKAQPAGGPKRPTGHSATRPDADKPEGRYVKRKGPGKPRLGGKGKKRPTDHEEKNKLPRLNQYIARAGVCSRREADQLIASGKVTVNGKVVREMGHRVHFNDKVMYEGKLLQGEPLRYLLLNKPKGFICNVKDEKGRKTVMDLVKKAGRERLYPVGRLERDTTGLLLFTNDGDLARRLTDPATRLKQIYHVFLDSPMKEEDIETLMQGIELDGEPVKPDVVNYVQEVEDGTQLGVQFHSGRNNFVRGMFEHFGYTVVKLDRVLYGNLTKKDIPRGKWRFLHEKEVAMLKLQVGKTQKRP